MSGVFLSWARDHGRTSDLAAAFELRTMFVYLPGRGGLIGRYFRQWKATRHVLRTQQPEVLWIQLPPAIALTAFLGLTGYRPQIVADLHTGFFLDPKWRWATGPSLRWLQRRNALAIVTNDHLKQLCERSGVRTYVMHDRISPGDPLPNAGHVLCPLSYANDEPIEAIMGAAALTPRLTWVCTGNAPESVRKSAPDNVQFTGFVDRETYLQLLRSAAVVCALTTRPHTMQRAGYEALQFGIPLVTSDFPELKRFFGDAASFAPPSTAAIAASVVAQTADRSAAIDRITELQTNTLIQQEQSHREILNALINGAQIPSPATMQRPAQHTHYRNSQQHI